MLTCSGGAGEQGVARQSLTAAEFLEGSSRAHGEPSSQSCPSEESHIPQEGACLNVPVTLSRCLKQPMASVALGKLTGGFEGTANGLIVDHEGTFS